MTVEYKVIVIHDFLDPLDGDREKNEKTLSEIFTGLGDEGWNLGSVDSHTAVFCRNKSGSQSQSVDFEAAFPGVYGRDCCDCDAIASLRGLLSECLGHLKDLKEEWSWKKDDGPESKEEYEDLNKSIDRVQDAIKISPEISNADDDDAATNG